MSSEEPLPPGWIVHKSRKHDREYFFNTRTGESRWERPRATAAPDAKTQAPAPSAAADGVGSATSGSGTATDGENPRRKRQRPQEGATSQDVDRGAKRPTSGSGGRSSISSLLHGAANVPVIATRKIKTRAELAEERFYQQKTKFRGEVEATLRSFMADEDATEHRFPPCDKEDRTIIHEVVAQLGLVSESEGENYERHAVVYKPGSEPEHLRPEAQEAAQQAQRARIEAQARAAKEARMRAQEQREREWERRRADGQDVKEVFVPAVARREREISMEQALLQAGWGKGGGEGQS